MKFRVLHEEESVLPLWNRVQSFKDVAHLIHRDLLDILRRLIEMGRGILWLEPA